MAELSDDLGRCTNRSYPRGYMVSGKRCGNSASVERDGKAYCRVHDPEAIVERRKAQEAKWSAASDAKEKCRAIEKARAAICDAGLRISKGRPLLGTLGFSELLDELDATVGVLRKIERGE